MVYGLGSTGSAMLSLNGGSAITVNGSTGSAVPFSFGSAAASEIFSGLSFEVSASSTGQTCFVTGGSGYVGNADVNDVVVNCAANLYTISGQINDLDGTVMLNDGTTNNDTITLSTTGNSQFSFAPQSVPAGHGYNVTVTAQPTYPPRNETCTVANGSGTSLTANVSNVVVTCTTNSFTVGGNVAELNGTLKLDDNGGDTDTITANGAFTFSTSVQSGSTYAVTINQNPSNENCVLTNATGTMANANVTNVSAVCDPYIPCGGTSCNPAAGDGCCNPQSINHGNASCTASNSCGFNNPFLACANTADCTVEGHAGDLCCFDGGGGGQSSCQTSCGGGSVMCDPNAPTPCASGTCTQVTDNNSTIKGYYTCN